MTTHPVRFTSRSTAAAASFACLALLAAAPARAGDFDIDPAHTTASFSVKHMMFTDVRGVFDKVSGKVMLDDKDLTRSKASVTIFAASVNTREAKRDAHLRSPDFFDVEKTPNITFASTKITKVGQGQYKVTGELTMRGVTRSVTLDARGPTPEIKTPWGGAVRSVSLRGKINRKDWGLTWNKALESGGVLVSDEVDLAIDVELVPVVVPKA